MTAFGVLVACHSTPVGHPDDPPASGTLPIEVLGEPPTFVTIVIDVPANVAAGADPALELVVDNVVAETSAYVRLEDGTALDLGASGLVRPFGGNARGLVPLPAGALHAGANSLQFGYERQIEAVSGFRILSLAVVSDGGRAPLALPADDPNDWTPPSDDPETIALGERLFTVETRDDGPTCAACHAADGADLAYFAFSNHSVEARAEHHLFDPDEASAIASYVRSLGVDAVGRVFDPPFQPGPTNHAAAGAGHDARLDSDDTFGAIVFPDGLPDVVLWDEAESFDTFVLPLDVEAPTWLRWLPRRLDPEWFARDDGRLAEAEAAMNTSDDLADARAFQEAAVQIGKEILIYDGDHSGRVEVLRYAAVKLWDWQRRHGGFDGADHGFPDGGPAFPYEVGFAFFEAAAADAIPYANGQAMSWWTAQLAVNPGRGRSTGDRPLDWLDVQLVAEQAATGPWTLTYLHLVGSLEESRGALADDFGTDRGPVRLLAVPMRSTPPELRVPLFERFLVQEATFLDAGGELTDAHHTLLADAWRGGCAALVTSDRQALRAAAPEAVRHDLADCPDPETR